jgi:hypothetical protein
VGLVIPEEDMPYTESGMRPDIIINPHALPSRMTIGQLVEMLMGKACATYGGFGDCTAFVNQGTKTQMFGNLLRDAGLHSSGNHVMYNGMSGEPLESNIFVGPTYYMRLKHMVKDKINYRAGGPRTMLTRQAVQGRANDGGLRIGEMERDGVLAHGASQFLTESFMKRGDEYSLGICDRTGDVAVYNPNKNIFLSPALDGPIQFTNTDGSDGTSVMALKNKTKYNGGDFSHVSIPYSFKLLMQELRGMNIGMRLVTDSSVNQLKNMSYSKTALKMVEGMKGERLKKISHIRLTSQHLQQVSEAVKMYNPVYEEKVESTTSPIWEGNEGNEGNSADSGPYPPPSPTYAPTSSPPYGPVTPPYPPSPTYAPTSSPPYGPVTPPYPPSPTYAPTSSPPYGPVTPPYPPSPTYAPTSSPPYTPTQLPPLEEVDILTNINNETELGATADPDDTTSLSDRKHITLDGA